MGIINIFINEGDTYSLDWKYWEYDRMFILGSNDRGAWY